MFSALLDTSVLWPSLQRDFLLSMAAEGLYRPLWSEAVLEELLRHERLKLQRRAVYGSDAEAAAGRLVRQMRAAFDDACVEGWEALVGSYGLPDPDDEHVVAAAVVGQAGVIVTENQRHFPAARVPRQIDVVNARDFAADTASVDPDRAALALSAISQRHRSPRHSPQELLELLVARYGMYDVADLLRGVL